MNSPPAICNHCGFVFKSPIRYGSAKNVIFSGFSTRCPKCGGLATIADSFTDSEGRLHIKDFFSHVQSFKDTDKLQTLKEDLEAANDKITADELAHTLVEIDPSFDKFTNIIKSLPSASISTFINILLAVLTLVILYKTLQSSEENHKESIEIQKSQLELSREQFEYQKEQDKVNKSSKIKADKERKNIQKQIDDLKNEFDKKLKDIDASKEKNNRPVAKSHLNGNQRNKPCPCGSGKKTKKCHPNGYYAK